MLHYYHLLYIQWYGDCGWPVRFFTEMAVSDRWGKGSFYTDEEKRQYIFYKWNGASLLYTKLFTRMTWQFNGVGRLHCGLQHQSGKFMCSLAAPTAIVISDDSSVCRRVARQPSVSFASPLTSTTWSPRGRCLPGRRASCRPLSSWKWTSKALERHRPKAKLLQAVLFLYVRYIVHSNLGSEVEVMTDLIVTGAIRHVNVTIIEWHWNISSKDRVKILVRS